MRTPTCPLCTHAVEDDDELREHLSSSHGLEDDEGRATTMDDLVILGGSVAAPDVAGRLQVRAIDDRRVFDPNADDERFRPIVLGIGGILLTLVVLGVLLVTGVF